MWFFITILTLMLALDLAWWRYADGLLRPMRGARVWRGLLAAFIGAQAFLLLWTLFARLAGPGIDRLTPTPLVSATYVWHLLALPILLLSWIAVGVFTTPVRVARWLRREKVEDPGHRVTAAETVAAAADIALEPQTCLASPSRRQFLGAAVAAAPPLLTAGAVIASTRSLDHFRVRPMTIEIPGLPRDLDGLSIAHVTDIHVGRFTHERQLRKIVEETNKLRADLVLMTGDLLNNSVSDLPGSMDAVNRLDPKHGVYLVEGNHDLFDGRAAFASGVRSAGVPLLVNEDRVVDVRGVPVQLLGLRWGKPGGGRTRGGDDAILRDAMTPLLQQRRPDAFPILLAHHPHAFDVAAEAGIPLTLAGHTHGGQLMLRDGIGFGPLMYRYWSGLYTRGASNLVVSNGVGNWFPIRCNAPAEIVHVVLRRKDVA